MAQKLFTLKLSVLRISTIAMVVLLLTIISYAIAVAASEEESESLAKAAQNPVADMISIPFQNNTNFNVGPKKETQNVLNIQPVVPFHLNAEWNLITRTILPLIYQPSLAKGMDSEFGVGDITASLFISPAKANGLIWGAGAALLLPTAGDRFLGSGKWGAGPTAVALAMEGSWVYGALVNNIWSFAGDEDRSKVNRMTIQPFINYNLPKGWYLSFSPIITADWEARNGQQWTVPVGGGAGKIVRLGKLPINLSLAAYYNLEAPDESGDWIVRFQVQFLFPTSIF